MALLLVAAATLSTAETCSDTPGWANKCSPACSQQQFPYGHTPGYFNASPPDAGWTCAMYNDNRTGWCADGRLVATSAGGARYNHPEENCCACGKGIEELDEALWGEMSECDSHFGAAPRGGRRCPNYDVSQAASNQYSSSSHSLSSHSLSALLLTTLPRHLVSLYATAERPR